MEKTREQPESFLACPFCGETQVQINELGDESYVADCYVCGAGTGAQHDAEQAKAVWNARAGEGGVWSGNRGKRLAPASWLDASARMKDILWEEASAKHQMSPDEEGWSDDYHLELTISVRELRAFAEGIAEASNYN